jgi:hypothetical protein
MIYSASVQGAQAQPGQMPADQTAASAPAPAAAGMGGQQAAAAPGAMAGGVSQGVTLDTLLAGQVPAAMLQSLTPNDMEQLAQQFAMELDMKPESIRLSMLRQLKQVHPTIHARTVQLLEEIRSKRRLVGGELLKMMQGGGPGMIGM